MRHQELPVEFAIYVSRSTNNNFDHSLKTASMQNTDVIWGSRQGILDAYLNEEISGKYMVFVVRLSDNMQLKGFPRIDEDKLDLFCKSSAKRIIFAKITSNVKVYDNPFWPDESSEVKYPFRFSFQIMYDYEHIDSLDNFIDRDICNAIRKGVNNGSMQKVTHDHNNHELEPNMSIDTNINDLVDQFCQDLNSIGYVADKLFVHRFISSLLSKNFLILSGLSGSGKTKLAQLFAHWLLGNDSEAICVIPVGADWVSNEHLIGYPDGLQPNIYVGKPLLKTILHAQDNPDLPHLVVLDEMNLSHVERYFSDFLSAMESNESIPLYEGVERQFNDKTVPTRLKLPRNLFIIGTINVDETTYMFSPKVLDRANVIEFRMNRSMVDSYFDNYTPMQYNAINKRGTLFCISFVNWSRNAEHLFDMNSEWHELYQQQILVIFDQMSAARVEFGYRVLNETKRFLSIMYYLDNTHHGFVTAFDAMIVQKLMSKLNGSGLALKTLLEYFANLQINDVPLPLTNDKSKRMLAKLKQDMYVSFAEA